MRRPKRTPKPRLTGDPAAGCVPHLPAPPGWPEKPVSDLDGCVPPEGLLKELSKLIAGASGQVAPKRR
jgi:hypothetical protein